MSPKPSTKITQGGRKHIPLEAYQAGLTPEEFYFDEQGIVLDIACQDQLRVKVCHAAWGNILSNEIWNIIKSDGDIMDQVVKKMADPDSILSKTLNLDSPALGKGHHPKDSFGFLLMDYRREYSRLKSGSTEERKTYREFCKDLFKKDAVKDPAEKMKEFGAELKDYRQKLKGYLRGGVVMERGREQYQYGWNEAEEIIKKEKASLEQKMADVMRPFYDMAASASNGGTDIRRASKHLGKNGMGARERQQKNDEYLTEYIKWDKLSSAIHNFRESDLKFDNAMWDVFTEKHGTKKMRGNGDIKALPPKQDIIVHPLISFTNNMEDKSLPLERRSGVTIVDPGVKTYPSFMRKAEDRGADQIMDASRITVAFEKSMGMGFLVNNLKQLFKKAETPTQYEKWSVTKSLFVSSKLNAALPVDKDCLPKEYQRSIPEGSCRGAEIKFTSLEQLKVKKSVSDAIYHLRREMSVENASGKREMLDVEDPANHTQAESIRQRLKVILKHKDVRAAMERYGMKMDTPTKEDFRTQVLFDMASEHLDKLESCVNASAVPNAFKGMQAFIYSTVKNATESGFKVLRDAFTKAELVQVDRAVAAREKDVARGAASR